MTLLSNPDTVNVGGRERLASAVGGGLAIAMGVRQGGLAGAPLLLLGAALMGRGLTGHSAVYDALSVTTAKPRSPNATLDATYAQRVDRSIVVDAHREAVYRFWRDFENFPRFMKHVKSVTRIDDTRSHWVVEGPIGRTIEWDAVIIHEDVPERIGWRSVEGARQAGSVRFKDAAGGRGTLVEVTIEYVVPGGVFGALMGRLMGEDPKRQLHEDLRRFKQVMESGEAAVA